MRTMSVINRSLANGPGERTVVWTQGCSKKCFNCYQPESWAHDRGQEYSCQELARIIRDADPEGLTLTGGDPFEQSDLYDFLELVQPSDLFLPKGVICFTGYTLEEIELDSVLSRCLPMIDLLIEGRYIDSMRCWEGLRGSLNQRFVWNEAKNRGKALIDESGVSSDQIVEVVLDENNTLCVTGFPHLDSAEKKRLANLGVRLV